MTAAFTVFVPLLERNVTVLVAKDPSAPEARDAFLAAYRSAGPFMKKLAQHDWDAFEPELTEGVSGLCVHSGPLGARVVVWVNDFRTGLLVHEISHATDAILSSTGIGDNTEMRAIVNEFITREAVNGLRKTMARKRAGKD